MSEPRHTIEAERSNRRLVVHGPVQGVGFRPFILRLATACGLAGSVRNTASGVQIDMEGHPDALGCFQEKLAREAPPGARIDHVECESAAPAGAVEFTIQPSTAGTLLAARVPADRATCTACHQEIVDPTNRRHGYAFTSCTQCGPRYSIIETMPYDRAATAMRDFAACLRCRQECTSPADRRFHAQANACVDCGPQVTLLNREGGIEASAQDAISKAAKLLREGRIVALKGLGGFQLLVRADLQAAVDQLRQRKERPTKPFALMFPALESAASMVGLSPTESQVLSSVQNPILLAKRRPQVKIAESVAPRTNTFGVLLPTSPLHLLLLAETGLPVVATSGNRTEEPIEIDERRAPRSLVGMADAFLIHNRPIVHRQDDSVVRVIAGKPTVLRLARGYAPLPLPALEQDASSSLLAVGGHQKVSLAAWSGSQAVLGAHLGDMDAETGRQAFATAVHSLLGLYRFSFNTVACDLHPDYFTSQWSHNQRARVFQVQHHHAHALACMAEHGLLDQEVLAFTWDGTGFGVDGTNWGGECLRARADGFERVASLVPFPLPGGEVAVREPRRVAFGLLYVLLGEDGLLRSPWPHRLGLEQTAARVLAEMIHHKVNTPWTSSLGRLFDGVAAILLGVGRVSYEGEAASWLEAVAEDAVANEAGANGYALTLAKCRDGIRGDWRPLLAALLADQESEVHPSIIAARFHNALAQWAAAVADRHPGLRIVLSGGCFQNRLLTERMLSELTAAGREVFTHGAVPPNDGGLAVGQLAAALAAQTRTRR